MPTASILIVEDEKIIAKGIEKRLKGLGYSVAGMVSTGEEAIQKAIELRPALILMDIRLGEGMDGVEAADHIRKQAQIPVVFLTAYSDDATLQRAKLTEPFGYVLKPYEDQDLQTAIEIGLYKHKMDQRLRENEQWLAATLASIGDGVIATDNQGCVRFLNSLAEQLTGWKQRDAFGKNVEEVFSIVEEKSRNRVPNPALEAIRREEIVTLADHTLLIDTLGVERPIDDSAAPIRDVNGKVSGAVLVFRDISERRRLEEHLRQAQKMESIGRLAGGIAHDFNNIMTVITGYSEILQGDGLSVQDRNENLRQISRAGKRAASLTQQILAFSRKQILLPCVLNLNTVVRDMASMVQRLIGEQIEFATEIDSGLGQVKADPTQLSQVILNLAVNARDAMPSGGRLTFTTANLDLTEPPANDPDVKPGRYAMLSVSDTGCGMPPDVLTHLFEPFFTTKGVGKGTGLGLATVFGIIKQSRGHIDVLSKVGVGSTFRIYLPLIDEPKPAGGIVHGERQMTKGNETILLVEDEDGVRRMTKIILLRNGYTVLEAANGLEALGVSERHPGTIDLLLTDIVMPHMTGPQLAERLSIARPQMKILFMSGYSEEMLPESPEMATAYFLSKPFTLHDLTRKLREVLEA